MVVPTVYCDVEGARRLGDAGGRNGHGHVHHCCGANAKLVAAGSRAGNERLVIIDEARRGPVGNGSGAALREVVCVGGASESCNVRDKTDASASVEGGKYTSIVTIQKMRAGKR